MVKLKVQRNDINPIDFFVASEKWYGKLRPYCEILDQRGYFTDKEIAKIEKIVSMSIDKLITMHGIK
jgi:hypothetical protein